MAITKKIPFVLLLGSAAMLMSCEDSNVCKLRDEEPQYLDALYEFNQHLKQKNTEQIGLLAERILSKDKCSYTGKYIKAVHFALEIDRDSPTFHEEIRQFESLMKEVSSLARNNAFVWATLAAYMQLWEKHEQAIFYYDIAIKDRHTPAEEAVKLSLKKAYSLIKTDEADEAVNVLMAGLRLSSYTDSWSASKVVETLSNTKNHYQLMSFWEEVKQAERMQNFSPETRSNLCSLLKDLSGPEESAYCEKIAN